MKLYVANVVLAAMPLFTAWPSSGQAPSLPPFERFPSTGGTLSTDRPLSAAVVGNWVARVLPDRTATLDLEKCTRPRAGAAGPRGRPLPGRRVQIKPPAT